MRKHRYHLSVADWVAVITLAATIPATLASLASVHLARVALADADKASKTQQQTYEREIALLASSADALTSQVEASNAATKYLKSQLSLQEFEAHRKPRLEMSVKCFPALGVPIEDGSKAQWVTWASLSKLNVKQRIPLLDLVEGKEVPSLTLSLGSTREAACSIEVANIGNRDARNVSLFLQPMAYLREGRLHSLNARDLNYADMGLRGTNTPRGDWALLAPMSVTGTPAALQLPLFPAVGIHDLVFLIFLSSDDTSEVVKYIKFDFTD